MEFGESSSDDDEDECDHCFGHVEKKKKNRRKNGESSGDGGGGGDDDGGEHSHDTGDSSGKEPSSWSIQNSSINWIHNTKYILIKHENHTF